MSSLVADYSRSGSENDSDDEARTSMMKPLTSTQTFSSMPAINLAPAVITKSDVGGIISVDPTAKELSHNPTYDVLFKPMAGPTNPFKTQSQLAKKNMLTGFVEPAHINDFHFEREIRTFNTHGYARDPSADGQAGEKFVGDVKKAEEAGGVSVFESKKTGGEKRKRVMNFDSTDVEGYTGPWGGYVSEERVSKPDPETLKEMEEFMRKKKKLSKAGKRAAAAESGTVEEKATMHLKETVDYQGRSFMMPPQDTGVNLRADFTPDRCFIPKKQIHAYKGHSKGVNCIRWFPKSAHLLLSCSMDSKVKLWEVYGKKRCILSYLGHKMPVRDICFNNDGTEFLSASFDRYIKLWDTETGQCKQRFHTGHIPFCVKFNPDEDKQHFFLSGMQNKKVLQWDTRSGECVQEYDRHLGSVNCITFFDKNRRFCSTSDDKSIRIWEWEIPVDTKLIQNSGLHSIPTMTKSPDDKWIVGQAMDNRILLFQLIDDKLR
uniref:Pre-mRNA-processing factor 17 n=1 Tax=Plectus sambesii TaxID=2011161 RepID=A0A914WM07_9BILA